MTTVQTNETKAATDKTENGRKDTAPKPTAAPAPATSQPPEPEAVDEIDRFEVLAKVVRILKPLPAPERLAVVAALTEMVR